MKDDRYKYFPVFAFPWTNQSDKFCVIIGYPAIDLYSSSVKISVLGPQNTLFASLGGIVQNSTISGGTGSGTAVNITNLPLTLVITRAVSMSRMLVPPGYKVTLPGLSVGIQVVQCETEADAMDMLKGS